MQRQVRRQIALRLRRGQAMIEYTLITHVLMLGGTFTLWVFSSYLFNAISKFYESIYWILMSSVP